MVSVFFFFYPCTNTPILKKIPAPSFTPSVSTAGNYFEPRLSAALHKVIMRPRQTDVDCSCLHSTWNSLGSLGVGERNSSLTHMDAFGLYQMEGKPANLLDSTDGFILQILQAFFALTFFFF